MASLEAAAQGIYCPKNFTEEEAMCALLGDWEETAWLISTNVHEMIQLEASHTYGGYSSHHL